MMKRGKGSFLLGLIVGAVMFSGTTAFAASGIMAQLSQQAIYVDGAPVALTAYTINGNNYVMLRDIGQAVGFNVYWDGAVQIDSDAPYTGVAPEETAEQLPAAEETAEPEETMQTAGEDLSLAANASIFDDIYTREAYNAIRQTVVDKQGGAYFAASSENRRTLNTVLSHIGVAYRYQLTAKDDGYLCTVEQPASYADAVTAVSGMLEEIKALSSDADKVRYINDVVCDRLTYQSGASAMPNKVFTTDGVLAGNCASYTKNFKFLCDLSGIPCVLVSSRTHGWNLVYVDGAWLYVDCVSNDVADDVSGRNAVLLKADGASSVRTDADPSGTAFAMELLVPNSTK